jgi:hypothetical protein
MKIVTKHCQKWNDLLLLFLTSLSESLPDVSIVNQARISFAALVALNPADATLLEHFMDALKGANDFILAQNTDIFSKASQVTSLITKDDVVNIYKKLDENDRSVVWKYLSKLYNLGMKACPEIKQQEFDFNSLVPHSPIHSLVTTAQSIVPSGKDSRKPEPGLIKVAFRQMCLTMLEAIANDCGGNIEINTAALATKQLLENTADQDPDCAKLVQVFGMVYPDDTVQGLIMNTEGTLREYGFPLVCTTPDEACFLLDSASDPSALIAAAMQASTTYVTLTSMDSKTILRMEKLAAKFYQQVQSGEISFGENPDPLSVMSQLAGTDMQSEILELIQGM